MSFMFFVDFKFRYCLVSVIVFMLLQIVEVYNEENQINIQFTPVIVFSKRDCLLVWKLVEYTFNH